MHVPSPKLWLASSFVLLVATFMGSAPSSADVGARQSHTIVFDASHQRFVLFGGLKRPGFTSFNDVWARGLSSTGEWTPLVTSGTPPPVRSSHTAIYDPIQNRMLVFGGYAAGIQLGDLWALDFDTPTPTWTQVATTGTPPSARSNHTAVYDNVRNRMNVFGGLSPLLNFETWLLDLNATPAVWQLREENIIHPSARQGHFAVYDLGQERMVIVGGGDGNVSLQDQWGLDFETWSAGTANPSNARSGVCAVYDPAGSRALTFGGSAGNTMFGDLRALYLEPVVLQWATLAPTGSVPSARHLAAMAIDPVSRQAVLHGGVNELNQTFQDTWLLALAPSPAWMQAPATAAVGNPRAAPFALFGFTPNPATRGARVAFSLPGRGPATIEVVDVTGRRQAHRKIESPSPGTTSIEITPEGGLAPGLYFVKLTQGSNTRVVRGTVVR